MSRTRVDRFELLRVLGRGGAGVVYQARDERLGDVAVKVLAARIDQARFERERRLLEELSGAGGFVPFLEAGATAQGSWLVMPLLTGGTLRDRLSRGRLSVGEALALARNLADAIGRAHARGVVHRDLKPENVLFDRDGHPRIADLGLAKEFDRRVDGASLSRTGELKGTVGYMAPEQIDDAKSVGPPADVFALGVILYEALSGRPPFAGQSLLEVMTRQESERYEPLRTHRPDVPPWFERVIDRALAREPAARFPDGAALALALAPPRDGRRHPRGLPILAALVVTGIGLAAWRSSRTNSQGPAPAAPVAPVESAGTHERRARALVVADELEAALAAIESALSLEPARASAWSCRGMIHELGGTGAQALEAAKRALALDPRCAEALAIRGLRSADTARARDDLDRAIELDPDNAQLHAWRGQWRLNANDPDGREDLDRAIELGPQDPRYWRMRSDWLQERDQVDQAISDATRAIELAPERSSNWASRGRAYIYANRGAEAVADYDRALELMRAGEDVRNLHFNRGIARWGAGDAQGGIEDETRALELEPGWSYARAFRGRMHLSAGDLELARADYEASLEGRPPRQYAEVQLALELARSLVRRGEPEEAARLVEDVLRGDPQHAQALQLRAAIQQGR